LNNKSTKSNPFGLLFLLYLKGLVLVLWQQKKQEQKAVTLLFLLNVFCSQRLFNATKKHANTIGTMLRNVGEVCLGCLAIFGWNKTNAVTC